MISQQTGGDVRPIRRQLPGTGGSSRLRNRAQMVLLLGAMAGLFAFCGWIVGAWAGIVWGVFAGVLALIVIRRLPTKVLLAAMEARPIRQEEAPQLYALFAELCGRAGLEPLPRLYHVEEMLPIAFSVGTGSSAAVVVSDALLAALTPRELRGVLAHEIVHLRNGDVMLKEIGFVFGWLTRTLSQLGLLLILFGFLMGVFSSSEFPFMTLFVLWAAPIFVGLLRLALSRSREAEADLEAIELTGDPVGLASALGKLQQWQEWRLRQLLPQGRIMRLPTLFNDHPPTRARIRRLLDLAPLENAGER
jgi:heat shock protein HtpX